MRETWYVLEDGTAVDPNECSADEKGINFTHKSGGKVAMRGEVPMSRGVDIDARKAEPKAAEPAKDREMKPGRAKKYQTR